MDLMISREDLLKPLQLVSGAVERRQTLPILANILLKAEKKQLTFVATDMEVELASHVSVEETKKEGELTVSARKLIDICRTLPEGTQVKLTTERDRLVIRAGKSRFVLSTLPSNEFPNVEEIKGNISFSLPQNVLKKTLENTHFSMAQQDVRYYLNGMLFELSKQGVKLVATDGHRLSLVHISNVEIDKLEKDKKAYQAIVPRKGIMELLRLLKDDAEEIKIVIGATHIHATTSEFVFTSKLVEGKFPDYSRVIPKGGDKIIVVKREELKQSLTRVAILSNEKYRGIRLLLMSGALKISANNPEQEEAEEELAIQYDGAELEIGFNVNYLIDICQAIESADIQCVFSDSSSSVLIEQNSEMADFVYVVMPMRL